MEQKNYPRFVAVKTTIKELLEWSYVQEDETNPNYLLGPEQQKVYRINLVGVVLNKDKKGSITSFLVDDSTGQILIRAFEESSFLEEINVGEGIMVIGKPRIYNKERYISPEIIKKINFLWLKMRGIEKGSISSTDNNNNNNFDDGNNNSSSSSSSSSSSNNIKREGIANKEEENQQIPEKSVTLESRRDEENIDFEEELPSQKIIHIIKEFDLGKGVPIELVIEKSPLHDSEQFIKKMLEKGEIFQISPGKVKVL